MKARHVWYMRMKNILKNEKQGKRAGERMNMSTSEEQTGNQPSSATKSREQNKKETKTKNEEPKE